MNIINFHISITNPWSKDRFKNLGSISKRITKNKSFELQHTFYDGTIFDASLKFTTKKDHAGLELVLGILTYGIHFNIYDHRHWDYENNKWQ